MRHRSIYLALAVTLFTAAPSPARAVQGGEAEEAVTAASQTHPEGYERTESFMQRFGSWSYVLAPLLMVVVAILPIPAELPAMLNGMMFGPIVGTTITWLGALVGAMVSFELARRFGRPLSERIVKRSLLERADRLVDSAGWPGLITLRLIPAVAFTAINWGAGFTSVNRWTFVWTTAAGILPGAIVFTASGTGLAVLLRMHPVAVWGMVVMGFLVVWWTVARYRRRPMRQWTGEFRTPAPPAPPAPPVPPASPAP